MKINSGGCVANKAKKNQEKLSPDKWLKDVRGMWAKNKKTAQKAALLTMAVIFILLAAFMSYSIAYAKRSFPKIMVGEVEVGGKKEADIAQMVKGSLDKREKQALVFRYESKEWKLGAEALKLSYDEKKTAEVVFYLGREKTFSRRLWGRLEALFKVREVPAVFTYNEKAVEDMIGQIAGEVNIPEHDADGRIEGDRVEIVAEKKGMRVEDEKLKRDVLASLAGVKDNLVTVPVETVNPKVSTDQAEKAKQDAEGMLGRQIKLTWEGGERQINNATIAKWIEFVGVPKEQQSLGLIKKTEYELRAQLNEVRLQSYVAELAKGINRSPKDAKLTINGGVVSVLQASEEGYKVDGAAATTEIKKALLEGGEAEIKLPITVSKPEVTVDSINNLGIKEIIGTATTTFTGSPANRIHNIKTGVGFLHGALVKPGAEFSVVGTLGKVDGSTGYLPELVIKENKTTPEYGGGLCQVSTTLFRSILNAGLKVMERQNHAYRVSYYEKDGNGQMIGPGLDATIYMPKPDLKFLNDTGAYILIQGRVEGKKITFDLWGTKDGRVSAIDGPHVSDITTPGEPIRAETDTLFRGQEQQVEKAHDGATAVVNYTVTRNGEVLYKQTFKSKYKAWPARFLVGTKEPPPGEVVPPTPTPTPEVPTPPPPTP